MVQIAVVAGSVTLGAAGVISRRIEARVAAIAIQCALVSQSVMCCHGFWVAARGVSMAALARLGFKNFGVTR